jgi:hypothetical protein
MANDKEIEEAVLAERERCTALLEACRHVFDTSSDKFMGHLWCRIRNQIALGSPVEEADFGVQMGLDELDEEDDDDDGFDDDELLEDDELDDELDDEFDDDDDEWHLDGGDHYPPPSQN